MTLRPIIRDEKWLKHLRSWCADAGALLVFDSMIYGGRWHLGGASGYFGIQPDLEVFGKAIGNGAPIACIVGNDVLREHGQIVSGTYSGDALALDAVLSTLQAYQREGVIDWMWARGKQLQRGLQSVCAAYPWAIPEGAPVHQRIRFADEAQGHEFSRLMMLKGILWHPACANLMRAHTEADIERTVCAVEESLRVMNNG